MKLSEYFFWWAWVKKIIWTPFWWVILFLIILWVPFLRVWWWVFLPIMLQPQLKILYMWWANWDFDYVKARWNMLEIVPPREVLTPFKAMEDILSVIWPIWDRPCFREKWCDGTLSYCPYWISFEIASLEGKIHFYLRCLQSDRTAIESALYSHYPDLEIFEVQDYVKLVPPSLPNEEWDTYGENFVLARESAYPIKTYEKFFEPQGERITAEEKRLDPIISLLESMSRLGPGEYYWMQFIFMPIKPDVEAPWFLKQSEDIIATISKRPQKKELTFLDDLSHTFYQLLAGPEKEGSGESATYKWLEQTVSESDEREMVLTPGEREIITEVENKVKKPIYQAVLRGVYVAKRENWKSTHKTLARSYFAHFATRNMNFILIDLRTRPKLHFFMRKRRAFLRARKMFRMSVLRFTPMFPDREDSCLILNIEELATLFHFPLRVTGMVAPAMSKVESRKAGPPPNLPIE